MQGRLEAYSHGSRKVNMRHVIVAAIVVLSALALGETKATTFKPCVVLSGGDSAIAKRGCHRILSRQQWFEIWETHKGQKAPENLDLDFVRVPDLPIIDFESHMVIAVFVGASSNCSGVKPYSVTEYEDRVVLRFTYASYQSVRGFERCTPYGFFVVPKSEKALVLEEDVHELIGDPPKWKQFAALPRLEGGKTN